MFSEKPSLCERKVIFECSHKNHELGMLGCKHFLHSPHKSACEHYDPQNGFCFSVSAILEAANATPVPKDIMQKYLEVKNENQ